MHQSLGVQEVLSDIAFYVDFVGSYMSDLSEHETAALLPRDIIWVENRDVSEQRIGVVLNACFGRRVQSHVLELVSELRLEHSLEQFFDVGLFAARNVFQVLQRAYKTGHSL